ncbi:MAG: hypothetical protein ACRETD_06675 [Steroidobacteraceae bacterium]
MQSRIATVVMTVAGIGAVAMFTIAFLKARPKPGDLLSATPATPASTSTVTPPAYDVLSGVSGLTPLQEHPDTLGTSIAPTNPS